MEERIFFKNPEDRIEFFETAKNSKRVNCWNNLAKHLGIKRGKLWYYRTGGLTLSVPLFDGILCLLPEKEKTVFLRKISKLPNNWGAVKGGLATTKKHPEILAQGRKIISKKQTVKYEFDINKGLNEEIAEVIGAFIGDGFTNKYLIKGKSSYKYQIGFSGDYRLDLDYYTKTIIPFIKNNLNKDFAAQINKVKNSNGMQINFHSKRFFEFLTQRLKMPAGLKFDKVLIPKEINESERLVRKCIRGIFDTDGCVFFDKRKTYKEPYIRITLKLCNPPLIEQIFCKLQELGIECKKLKNGREIQIIGPKNVEDFVKKIGFSNKRHLNKIPKTMHG